MAHHRSSGLRGWEIALGLLAAVVIIAGSWSLWTGQRADAASTPTRPPTATTAAQAAVVTAIASAITAPPSPASAPSAAAPLAPPTTAPPTATTPLSPTVAAARSATATPDMAGAGHVSALDPAVEARRQVVGKVGDGALGNRAATLLNDYYAVVSRAYRDNNPELLRPILAESAFAGYQRDITRINTNVRPMVPVLHYRFQPTIKTNLRPNTYAVRVAEIRYDRVLDGRSRAVVSISRPYRDCVYWYLIEVNGALKIEGSTSIPEDACDAGWPELVTPTMGE